MTTLALNKYDYAMYYPFLGLRVRGKLPGIAIFKEYWYGRRVDKLYVPYNPNTDQQQAWRSYFAAGVAVWQGLTPAEKVVYQQDAKRFKILGFNRFLTKYLLLNRSNIG